jgi:uncharacterized protein (DUF2164 family)
VGLENFDLKPGEKKQMIDEIIAFFDKERDEDIGILAAELVLDFFLDNLGKKIYNKGIDDAYVFINDKLQDIYALEKR